MNTLNLNDTILYVIHLILVRQKYKIDFFIIYNRLLNYNNRSNSVEDETNELEEEQKERKKNYEESGKKLYRKNANLIFHLLNSYNKKSNPIPLFHLLEFYQFLSSQFLFQTVESELK